ncbi:hypothetical protein [Streptomyces canus]|uniref:hypothetical protein n=1 Tax=Streptomyces canus TaxID=58343 RepID=UPI00277EB722|nr:hypothetical protein [Streptomyces canus]MDQ0757468.1 hypothetical protein [Streptomyces canus]
MMPFFCALVARERTLRGPQNALLVGLVRVTDRDDVAIFVFAPLMDGFAAAVGPQPQVHRGLHTGVLAHSPAQQVPLTDWDIAVGVHLVHAVDHVPQIRMLLMAEVIEIQIKMHTQFLCQTMLATHYPPFSLKCRQIHGRTRH